MDDRLKKLEQMRKILWQAEGKLRAGEVVYAYRQMGYLAALLEDENIDRKNSYRRIMNRLHPFVEIHDEIKSMIDRINNEEKEFKSKKRQ